MISVTSISFVHIKQGRKLLSVYNYGIAGVLISKISGGSPFFPHLLFSLKLEDSGDEKICNVDCFHVPWGLENISQYIRISRYSSSSGALKRFLEKVVLN